MKPCCISWCVAMTDNIFCSAHELDQHLHPAPIDPERELEEAFDNAATQGYNEGYEAAKEEFGDNV